MLPSSELKEITFKDYLVIFVRRFWVILSCFIVITSWVTISSFRKVNLYKASAKIVIENNAANIAPVQQVYGATQDVSTQIGILTSRSLAKKVIDKLQLEGDKTFSQGANPEIAFLNGVAVDVQRGTSIINLSYVSQDAVKAAKYANILVDVYLQQDAQKKTEATRYAIGWLDDQLNILKKKLRESEDALNDYVKKNDIISIPDIEKRTTTILENLKQEKVTVEKESSEMSKRYKPKHPSMAALRARAEAIDKSIADETRKLLDINDKMKQYNVLKRDTESNKTLYDSLLQRAKETEVAKELETTNIRVLDFANVPSMPFSPNRPRDILTAALLSLFLGIGLAFFIEYIDSTVKTADDIEMYVKLPFLGYVPSAKKEVKVEKDMDLVVHKMPQSRVSEAYRSIRTSIIFSSPEDKPIKTLLITSSSPQEGKTTVSTNLAIVFAHANEKVILIDADLRRGRANVSLGLDASTGLSSYLTGNASLDKIIMPTFIPNLSFIASGPRPPNPAELLASAKTRALLDELKTKYDRVIIDTPPIVSIADTSLLANIADGVIDVIRAGFVNIDIILRGRQKIYEAKSRIIGVILNNVNVRREDSYYYYHYYYSDKEKGKKT